MLPGAANIQAIPQVNICLSFSLSLFCRMDLPPSFKPPPPPVKYTAARRDIPTQPFPTSRCNSVAYDGIIY